MTRHIKQFLRGVGSVIDIAPAPRHRDYFQESDGERLRADAERIGADMMRVYERRGQDAKNTSQTSR
ncbi:MULTISPECIES: hypothetical protein [Thiorhodovibrio]|uniref:hypothetical protein n=1 Tax=Thiorhodovibrio TaxID=61593 RepID=UPI00191137D4|nr:MULTISPECIES: hypothetical protein [Thiorhodovibrio]MBK5970078.1 hypothetical protein [Thiorhodovibrio winogradskyi]WPL13460.1 hypothetical protein Thiosp_03261 [Thiorhodovibrio litoralis]